MDWPRGREVVAGRELCSRESKAALVLSVLNLLSENKSKMQNHGGGGVPFVRVFKFCTCILTDVDAWRVKYTTVTSKYLWGGGRGA